MAETWTRDAVIELLDGDECALLDRDARRLPSPDWLPCELRASSSYSTGQRLAALPTDLRQQLIETWWQAMNAPGELIEIEFEVERGDRSHTERTRYLNLLDEPGIEALIVAIRREGDMGRNVPDEVVQSGEYETVDVLIHVLDQSGIILETEGKVFEITGRTPESVIGQSVLEHLHPDGYDDALTLWVEMLQGPAGTSRSARQRVVRLDGSTIWVESMTMKRVAEDGTVTCLLIAWDLTESRKQESALRTSQLEFQLLSDMVPGAVFRTDAHHRVTFRNQAWITELDREGPIEFLHEVVHEEDLVSYDEHLGHLAATDLSERAEFEVRSRDGERVLLISCRSVWDLVNEQRTYVGAVTDITSTVRLRERAERDGLTGLMNRPALEDHLAAALAAHEELAVVFIDVDDFKAVNDSYGHAVGDAVLTEVARRLRDCVRAHDVVARFGGDEFIVVVRDDDELDEHELVDRLALALRPPITWDDGSWRPRASFGVARPRQGDDVQTVLTRADDEMFAAKREHKLRLA